MIPNNITKSVSIISILLVQFSNYALCKDQAKPIHDIYIKMLFEKKLGKLKDQNKTSNTNEIATQLNSQNSIKVNLQEPNKNEISPSEIYSLNKEGVLCLGNIYKCDKCDNWHGNIAGGFIISDDGLAVTNYHVMQNDKAGAFGALSVNGQIYSIDKVVASSQKDDLAIVKLIGSNFKPVALRANAPVGSDVTVISHPEGRFYTVSRGIVSRYYLQRGGKEKGSNRIAITADFAKGSSGSPVFDNTGSVIGVVAATNSIYYNKVEGIERNLQMVVKSCIPTSSILKLLNSD
jgi:S1-C subfamily serine protease